MKMEQYKLLTSATAHLPETQLQAAKLARDAVRYDNEHEKYLRYIPAL